MSENYLCKNLGGKEGRKAFGQRGASSRVYGSSLAISTHARYGWDGCDHLHSQGCTQTEILLSGYEDSPGVPKLLEIL